ncbi:MAG: DUF1833 family protein [Rhizobacter sp.]
MPSYLPPRKGVSLSEAYAEAAAVAPLQRAMLHCYEVWHPTMAEPIRVVRNYVPLMARLEADAPRNSGELVEHLACAVKVERPAESDAASEPELAFSIDNVNGLLKQALDQARGSRDLWEVIERVYASDDTSAPALLPTLRLTFTQAQMKDGLASLTASYGDPVNVSLPRITFKPEEYLGLAAR